MKLDFNNRLLDLTILDLSEKDMPGTNILAYFPHYQLEILKITLIIGLDLKSAIVKVNSHPCVISLCTTISL